MLEVHVSSVSWVVSVSSVGSGKELAVIAALLFEALVVLLMLTFLAP